MLSLAYRIATMKIFFRDHLHKEADLVREASRIKKLPKIGLDNVHQFFLDSQKIQNLHVNDLYLKVPNWSPPFSEFWAEYTRDLGGGDWEQLGIHLTSIDLDAIKEDRRDVFNETWDKNWNKFNTDDEPRPVAKTSDGRWIIELNFWSAGRDTSGSPCRQSLKPWMLLNAQGKVISHIVYCPFEEKSNVGVSLCAAFVFGLGVSFMHCKNVRQVETKIDPGERFRKQYNVPKYTYRTLQIDPMKEVLRREGRSDTEGLQRALHICRGYFSTYSDDKPLFGKYPGTFWVPDHVRGSKEQRGEVVKDYNVKPGE